MGDTFRESRGELHVHWTGIHETQKMTLKCDLQNNEEKRRVYAKDVTYETIEWAKRKWKARM